MKAIIKIIIVSLLFQAIRGQPADLTCPGGWYKTAQGCRGCPIGSACPVGSTAPIPCEVGEYTAVNSEECADCPGGYYCPSPTVLLICPVGQLCEFGSTKPVPCPANRACTRQKVAQCPPPTFSREGDGKCSACPAGKYCPRSGEGEYSCAPGTWSPPSSQQCLQCENQYECSDPSSPPKLCPIGTLSNAQRTACVPCPAGYECSNPANPTRCPSKFYSDAGASYCTLCPQGHYCPDGKAKTPCGASSYAWAGQDICFPCEPNHHCQATFSKRCAPGFYSQNNGPCQVLPQGFYLDASFSLAQCPAGSYLNEDQTQCYPCPSGHQCLGFKALPTRCAIGTYIQNNACVACPAGQVCPYPNLPPQSCSPGYYYVERGQFCTLCTRGYYCPGGAQSRIKCPRGFTSLQGANSCDFQEIQGFVGDLVKIPILTGFYKDGAGNIAECPVNHYCPVPYEDPIACPPGWFSFRAYWTCIPKQPGLFESPQAFGIYKQTPQANFEQGYDWVRPCPSGTFGTSPGICDIIPENFELDFSVNPPIALKACQAGWYSPRGVGSCRPVSAGFYLSAQGIQQCPINHYCRAGFTVPAACPAGTFSPAGSSTCHACPPGFSCSATGELTICPAGQYSRVNEPDCKPCSAGFLCYEGDSNPRNQLQSCPRGYYCPVDQATQAVVMKPCPAGTYGVMERAYTLDIGCQQCPAGFICPEAVEHYKYYSCPSNYYCPDGASEPQPCPPGTFYEQTGAISEFQCKLIPGGYFLDAEGKQAVCPRGHFCPQGYPRPIPCQDGMFHKEEGASTYLNCINCPPGYVCKGGHIFQGADPLQYISYHGASQKNQYPVPPGSGWNKPNNALYFRVSEEANKVADLGGEMRFCQKRTFDGISGIGQLQCARCKPGQQCIQGVSSICPQGKYCIHDDQNEVADCPPGTYGNIEGAEHPDQCRECPQNSFCPGGGTEPEECPLGFYCPKGTVLPERCPDGTYGSNTGLGNVEHCWVCLRHNYCRDGFKYPCPPGFYQPQFGGVDCLLCPGGYYCNQNGNSLCPKGTFSATGDVKGCQSCPRGFACNHEGIDYAELPSKRCPNGYNCDKRGTQDLVLHTVYGQYAIMGLIYTCPQGTFHLDIGAESILECQTIPAGFFADITQFSDKANPLYGVLQECVPGSYCPRGSWKPVPCPRRTFNIRKFGLSLEDCELCLAGHVCDEQGMSTYKPCPKGFYCPRGTDRPEHCPIGTFDPFGSLKSVAECSLCPPGKYCSERGLTTPKGDCFAGFLCTLGSPRPDPINEPWGNYCPPGGFCPSGTALQRNCPKGTYNPLPRGKSSEDCAPCIPGYYCLGDALPTPTGKCPGGHFCPKSCSDPTANPASPGNYAPQGSPMQIPCIIGTYAPNSAMEACLPCPAGQQCPIKGSVVTSPCPEGFYCEEYYEQEGKIHLPQPCPPGTFRSQTGAKSLKQCTSCPPGKACPFYGLTYTLSCSAGFFCELGSNDINPTVPDPEGKYGPCPFGHYCGYETGAPNPCPVGTFLPYEGARDQSECIECLSGQYCGQPGLREPEGPCYQGFYCPAGSSSAFQNECKTKHFCPLASGQQHICPEGFYQIQKGAYQCNRCPGGYYCINGKLRECPKGRFCP